MDFVPESDIRLVAVDLDGTLLNDTRRSAIEPSKR